VKLLVDYKQDELVNLTDDEKQTLFLLECAERGVPLPDTIPAYMPSPDEREDLKEDATVFSITIGRYSSDKAYFANIEDAQEVVKLIKSKAIHVDSDYRSGKSTYFISDKDSDELSIETAKVYTKNKYNEVKEELSVYEKQKGVVDANNRRRSESMKKQEEVMTEIDNAIYEAQRVISRTAELKELFEKYKKMANGDYDIAVRFLLNAHYTEVTEYEDENLPKIGITRADIEKYNEASKQKEDEE
jgi:hypothetical protein